jgi:hypothetical protein
VSACAALLPFGSDSVNARLPQEAAEALLNLATGTTPAMPERAPIEADPFADPDAQRRSVC